MTACYALLALRGLQVFPHTKLSFDAGRAISLKAVETALEQNKRLFVTAQVDPADEDAAVAALYPNGTLVRIRQVLKLPGNHVRVLVEGLQRGQITARCDTDDCLFAEVELVEMPPEEHTPELDALYRTAQALCGDFASTSNRVTDELTEALEQAPDRSAYADILASHLLTRFEDRQKLLETVDLIDRYDQLIQLLNRELQVARVEREIQRKVKTQLDKNQKEYVLREQLHAIRSELGEEGEDEIEQLRQTVEDTPLSDEVRGKVLKEIARLEDMPPGSHEATVSRNWLDWVLALPWKREQDPPVDIARARQVLQRDHYALDKVKQRVLEYLAVRALVGGSLKGPILCLVGPPGVGKTSIGRSIAEAMQRKFIRMSLGGVRDEAEIRGHRRTYIGAVPGRILTALRQAGVNNPLIMLDEIDKLAHDVHGDPASALLEVLDSEQNNSFSDHYLDAAFDLSQAVFIATANTIDVIPRPLLDRMEIIECPGYTDEEKLQIAKRHLLPRQLQQHGLKPAQLRISDAAIRGVLDGYTRESGVRQLERQIAAICRKAALKAAEGSQTISVTVKNLPDFLGKAVFYRDDDPLQPTRGVATGLAWTAVGGETLQVEALWLTGTGKITLTGQMGDVMQESAQTALSLVRRIAEAHGVSLDASRDDWHIHIPEGAVQKDGPSAGITMATAMLSACTGKLLRPHLAMTGELTLTGRVLPVGGIKEKVLAANRAGVTTIILPHNNQKDLDELPQDVRQKINFIPVTTFDQVVQAALAQD